MTITLPYPPSANRYWRLYQNRIRRSTDAIEYINTVGKIALAAKIKPTSELVSVSVQIYRPAKRGDLDNTLKVLLDSLRGFAYVDDAQIARIAAERFDDKSNPRAIVTVEPY